MWKDASVWVTGGSQVKLLKSTCDFIGTRYERKRGGKGRGEKREKNKRAILNIMQRTFQD